ncbi:hypothetical protein AN220_00585 [Streptomyces nanshensis]|nr:hypothetical protein AN220_00585 [Streptomyces nanshensis]
MDLPIGPILEYYGVDVPELRPGGRWKSVKCVFHDDSNASASVSYTGYKCHSCPAHGSAVTLIAWKESIDYSSAERRAKEILGPSYEEVPGRVNTRRNFLSDESRTDKGGHRTFQARVRAKPSPRARARNRVFGDTLFDS